jgi:hypothetical protein
MPVKYYVVNYIDGETYEFSDVNDAQVHIQSIMDSEGLTFDDVMLNVEVILGEALNVESTSSVRIVTKGEQRIPQQKGGR